MNSEELINKAKIKLQKKSPFFSYLSLYLKIRKAREGELPDFAGAGVNARGDLLYNDNYFSKLEVSKVMGILCHEILHLSLLHLTRLNKRQLEKWNICCDLVVNTILRDNGFQMDKRCLIPNEETDEYKIKIEGYGEVVIKDVSKKTAEQIYDELPEFEIEVNCGMSGKGNGNGYGKGKGKGKGYSVKLEDGERFDEHFKGDGKGKKNEKGEEELEGYGEGEINGIESEWLDRLNSAVVHSKMRGNIPAGFERLFSELNKSTINWRVLLNRYIQASIPHDYSWAKRSKSSIAIGTYLPSSIKEEVDVTICIDTSGSIDNKILTAFLSEIIGLANTYQNRISMRVISADCSVNTDYHISNGSVAKIKKMTIKGGGGTSVSPALNHIANKYGKTKLVLYFTDGYIEGVEAIEAERKRNRWGFDIVWILDNKGDESIVSKFGRVLRIK